MLLVCWTSAISVVLTAQSVGAPAPARSLVGATLAPVSAGRPTEAPPATREARPDPTPARAASPGSGRGPDPARTD